MLEELKEKQKILDSIVWKNFYENGGSLTEGLEEQEKIQLWKLALLTEISEFSNELSSFKYWKKNKTINWERTKEELIDCLHFFLTLTNFFQVDFSNYQYGKENEFSFFSLNELLLALIEKTISFNFLKTEENKVAIYCWFQIFECLCKKTSISFSEIEKIYLKKYQINLERQKNHY